MPSWFCCWNYEKLFIPWLNIHNMLKGKWHKQIAWSTIKFALELNPTRKEKWILQWKQVNILKTKKGKHTNADEECGGKQKVLPLEREYLLSNQPRRQRRSTKLYHRTNLEKSNLYAAPSATIPQKALHLNKIRTKMTFVTI